MKEIKNADTLRLLEEIDKNGLTVVPYTEDTILPVKERLRQDHDYRWMRTPTGIKGPWTRGFTTTYHFVPRASSSLSPKYDDYKP